MSFLLKVYKDISTPEDNGRKIGLFRILCSIFGGLLVAYLAMTFLTLIIPGKVETSIILPLLFNTLAWSCIALWISVSSSKLSALLKVIIPSLIFSIFIFILY